MDETTIPRNEIIQVADIVAREKSIDREIVFIAMEEAIQKAGQSRYGIDRDIRAHIDRKNGAINLQRWTLVVEEVEDSACQITTENANLNGGNFSVGDYIKENLPPIDFGRIAAQTAKQVIVHKVREAEREKQFEEYKDRVGDIVLGTVKRVDNQTVTVDLGRGEAVIRREAIAKEVADKEAADKEAADKEAADKEALSSTTTKNDATKATPVPTVSSSTKWGNEGYITFNIKYVRSYIITIIHVNDYEASYTTRKYGRGLKKHSFVKTYIILCVCGARVFNV